MKRGTLVREFTAIRNHDFVLLLKGLGSFLQILLENETWQVGLQDGAIDKYELWGRLHGRSPSSLPESALCIRCSVLSSGLDQYSCCQLVHAFLHSACLYLLSYLLPVTVERVKFLLKFSCCCDLSNVHRLLSRYKNRSSVELSQVYLSIYLQQIRSSQSLSEHNDHRWDPSVYGDL